MRLVRLRDEQNNELKAWINLKSKHTLFHCSVSLYLSAGTLILSITDYAVRSYSTLITLVDKACRVAIGQEILKCGNLLVNGQMHFKLFSCPVKRPIKLTLG